MKKNISKEKSKALTLEDIIAKKAEKEDSKKAFKNIYIKSLGGDLTFSKPTREDILDCMDAIDDETKVSSVYEGYKKIIYDNCEILKNKELQSAYGVKFNEIVEALLEVGEVMSIGNELIEFGGGKVDVKNS